MTCLNQFDLQVNLHVMKTFLSENQRWPFSRFSFFITLEVGDALVLSYLESSGRIFVSSADQKTRRIILAQF